MKRKQHTVNEKSLESLRRINEIRKKNSNYMKFIKICEKILDGEYEYLQKEIHYIQSVKYVKGVFQKKRFAKLLNVKSQNMSKILRTKEVIDFFHKHKILNSGQNIIFTSLANLDN